MADNSVLISIRADTADILAKLDDVKGYIGGVTDETKRLADQGSGYASIFQEGWVKAAAGIAAAWATANQAIQLMDAGTKAQQIASSFQIVAGESGAMANDMIANMKRATQGTVAESDLQQKAVKLMLAGYDPQQIKDFSAVAVTASQYMGVNVSEAYDRISDALATRMPRAMVQAGAVTREQMQIVTEAIKAGADQSDLMALAIENLRVKQAILMGTEDEATLAMQRFHAEIEEAKKKMGSLMFDAITPIIPILGDLNSIVGVSLSKSFWFVSEAIKVVWTGFQTLAIAAVDVASGIVASFEYINKGVAAVQDALGFKEAAADTKKTVGTLDALYNDLAGTADAMAMKINDAWASNASASKSTTAQEIADRAQAVSAAKEAVAARVAALQALIDAHKHAAADMKNILKGQMDDVKAVYDFETAQEKDWLKLQRDDGAYAFDLAIDFYNKRNDTIYEAYSKDWDLINQSGLREAEKYKLFAQLDDDYTKKTNANQSEYQKNFVDATNQHISVMAAAYQTLGWYSDAATATEIASVNNKYKALHAAVAAGTQDEIALNQAKALTLIGIDEKTIQSRLSSYQQIGIYAADSATLINKLGEDAYEAALIRYKDDENAYAIAEKAKTNVIVTENLKRAELEDDFWAGIKAAYDKNLNDMTTWGTAGVEVFKSFSTNANNAVSGILFDGIKGQMKSFSDYWHSFTDALLKTFTDICAKMLVQWAMVQSGLGSLNVGGAVTPAASGSIITSALNALTGGGTNELGQTTAEASSQAYANLWSTGSTGAGAANTLAGNPIGSGISTQIQALWDSISGIGEPTTMELGVQVPAELGGETGLSTGLMGTMAELAPFAPIAAGYFGAITAYLNRSNAGFGSYTHSVTAGGLAGGFPDFGTWATESGAVGPAPATLLQSFAQNIDTAIGIAYQSAADYIATLPVNQKSAIVNALANTMIAYLPTMQGLAAPEGGYFSLDVTREQAANLKPYVESIPAFILSQLSPVIGATLPAPAFTASGLSIDDINALFPSYSNEPNMGFAKGLDYVPYDNFPAILHRGERVMTASDNSGLAAKIDQLITSVEKGNAKTQRFAEQQAKILRRWDGDGMPDIRTV